MYAKRGQALLDKLGRDNELLTPAEVAGLFYVDPKTASRWGRDSLLPCVITPGGHRRFRTEDVRPWYRAMLDSQRGA